MYFKGAGIKEHNEEGEWHIKSRVVRLKRREFTEEFIP